MDNSYFTTISPYFAQQDQQGLSPVFQNIGQQQAMQNAALAQQNQQIQDAGAAFNQGGGMNPMAMAMALRGKKPDDAMNMLNNASSSQDYMNKIGATSSGSFNNGGTAGDYANEWWMK